MSSPVPKGCAHRIYNGRVNNGLMKMDDEWYSDTTIGMIVEGWIELDVVEEKDKDY